MSDDPLLGTVLAERYRVDRLIGEGAMGRVFEAEHIHMRKRVAVKVLHRELTTVPEIMQRFEREARAAAQIEHPHVAAATDFGKLSDGGVYLVLEFIEGKPLSRLIDEGPVKLARVLMIAIQVASALEAAHERGIVHRDLKPDNLLLVQSDDETDFVKVLDFGIAKVPTEPNETGRPITQVGMVYGTPEYMAPEQALGQEVDARADLYALGVVMFELLTGRRPYDGPVASLLGKQLSTPLPKMADVAKVRVPAEVEELVRQLLIPEPARREASAQVIREKLEALLVALQDGKLKGAEGRGSLLSVSFEDISSTIGQVTDNLPRPVRTVVKSRVSRTAVMALAFGAAGVVGAILLVGALVSSPEPAPSKLRLTEPPPPVLEVPEADPNVATKLEQARSKGIEALEKLAEELPTEGLVRAELALAYAKNKRFEDAVDSSRIALALDPNLNENAKVAGALFRAAQSNNGSAATFRLLKGPMGAAGVGIIYDLARTEGISARIRSTAEAALKDEEVRSTASPSLKLVLDLETAESCEELRSLVERAALVGDKRAIPKLQTFTERHGCGPEKSDDCYPCLRENSALVDAISTIENRVTLSDEGTASPSATTESGVNAQKE